MSQIINIFLKPDFEPHKNRNHLSVDEQNNLYYSNKARKPSKLWKVREAAQNVLKDAVIITSEDCDKVTKNVNKLNEKIKKHNDRLIVKLFDIVAKIVKIFNENWGNQIKNYYHVEEIEIPDHLINSRNNADEQEEGPATVQGSKTVNNNHTRDKGKEKIDELGSTDTVKINEDYDSESDREECLSDSDEFSNGTFMEYQGKNDTGQFEGLAFEQQNTESIKDISDPQPLVTKTLGNWLKATSATLPQWAIHYAEPQPKSEFSIPGGYYIETTQKNGGLKLLNKENILDNDMKWDIFDAAKSVKSDVESGESVEINEPRPRSTIRIQWDILPDEVTCHFDNESNLLINNRSGNTLYVSEYDQVFEIPNGKHAPIYKLGTFFFWFNNKEKTGFVVNRRQAANRKK